MALNKQGMDLKAIRRDQKAIDSLPNKGRAKAVNKALSKHEQLEMKAHKRIGSTPAHVRSSEENKRFYKDLDKK